MSVSAEVLKETRNLVFISKELSSSLLDMWRHKGGLPTAVRHLRFDGWLDDMVEHMSEMCKSDNPWEICKGLEVNVLGVGPVVSCDEIVNGFGFETDTCGYVEDGTVYASVWVRWHEPKNVSIIANKIAKAFSCNGWAVDTWVDPEDNREVTVNASVDFGTYIKMLKEAKQCGTINGEQEEDR